jgi:hypothetical protein
VHSLSMPARGEERLQFTDGLAVGIHCGDALRANGQNAPLTTNRTRECPLGV